MRRDTTRRRLAVAVTTATAAALLASACSSGSGGGTDKVMDPPKAGEKVTVTIWSGFSADREVQGFESVLKAFTDAHPDITVKHVGDQDDDKITQAIRGGTAPDITVSFSTDFVGQYCASGAWQNLTPYINRDKLDLTQFPEAVRDYTSFKGNRCALPMLADVYGLYYNKKLLAEAGYDKPPTTATQLMDMAKKLTVLNSDGSIKTLGYLPLMGPYENAATHYAPTWGASWQTKDGASNLAGDPAWSEFLTWQKQFVDAFGADKLTTFAAGMGDEFSADNVFETGKVAMMLDGEWRTAFLADEHPELDYGTAPFVTADDKTDLYGGGYVTGTIIGMPKGAKHAGAAWELVKYLTTDDTALVSLANLLGNVPTTLSSLDAATDLKADPHFKTFLDIFASPHLASSPASPNGGQYQNLFEDFIDKWQTGKATDLAAGLKATDKQIDDAVKLGEKP